MSIRRNNKRAAVLYVFLWSSIVFVNLFGVQTKTVHHVAYTDFIQGDFNALTLSQQGVLALGHQMQEVAEIGDAVVFDAVADSQGNLYLGTGNQGKVFKVNREGELKTIFSTEEIFIRALAVDSKDTLYVGTAPNGRVYRLRAGENPEVYFDPEADYIWDMLIDDEGQLYVATGSPAKIFKLSVDFRLSEDAELLFETHEEHIPVLALGTDGSLLAGTSPSALLYQVIPGDTRGKVLHNADADEITAIFPDENSIVFATMTHANGSGDQTPMDLPQILERMQVVQDQNGVPTHQSNKAAKSKPDSANPSKSPSFIYRLHLNGFAEPLWSPGSANIFAMSIWETASWLVGTDTDGSLYQVEDGGEWLLHQQAAHGGDISAILSTGGSEAKTFIVTSNPAVVYVLSPAPAALGRFESVVIDAQQTARWGHVRMEGALNPSDAHAIMWSTRSGNVPEPDDTWSQWQTALSMKIQSPSARYLQYKVEIDAADAWVDDVRLFYSHFNVAPIVSSIKVVTVGIDAFETKVPKKPNLNLTQLLSNSAANTVPIDISPTIKPQFRTKGEQGFISFVWKALDPNGDALQFTLELKKKTATQWSLLAEDLHSIVHSINTRGYEDGYYMLRVTADDSQSNPAGEEKQGQRVSYPFLIDNGSPMIKLISQDGDAQRLRVRFLVEDAFSVIDQVDYNFNGQESLSLLPMDIHYDQQQEEFELLLTGVKPGNHSLIIKAKDELNNFATLPVTLSVED